MILKWAHRSQATRAQARETRAGGRIVFSTTLYPSKGIYRSASSGLARATPCGQRVVTFSSPLLLFAQTLAANHPTPCVPGMFSARIPRHCEYSIWYLFLQKPSL